LHCTANGKASLALLPDSSIKELLPKKLQPFTDTTPPTLDALFKEIVVIRRTGLAFDREEHSDGISAIGTAFLDTGGLIYAISVPMPTKRFRVKSIGDHLLSTARAVVHAVGGRLLVND
jgi:DNA-binding IclR family transcriptional regulator